VALWDSLVVLVFNEVKVDKVGLNSANLNTGLEFSISLHILMYILLSF